MALQSPEATVAVLIDCDNVPPDIAEFALQKAAQAGRVTVRRGYGNPNTLDKGWEPILVRQSFTTCLQYPYASRKNTTDIALALDALELLLEKRAQTFCLVTCDSDFAYLCRKLRERGATVYVAGGATSPDGLRNACDQFFEWTPKEQRVVNAPAPAKPKVAPVAKAVKAVAKKAAPPAPVPKQSPPFVLATVVKLAPTVPNGRVPLAVVGQHLKDNHPNFKPNVYGHAKLLNMLRTYKALVVQKHAGGHWVSLKQAAAGP